MMPVRVTHRFAVVGIPVSGDAATIVSPYVHPVSDGRQ